MPIGSNTRYIRYMITKKTPMPKQIPKSAQERQNDSVVARLSLTDSRVGLVNFGNGYLLSTGGSARCAPCEAVHVAGYS